MQDLELAWFRTEFLESLGDVAGAVATSLLEYAAATGAPFCLWLQGGLGAGKTTFTGALLRAMGLGEGIPVTSPTYTYMNEYHIPSGLAAGWYAHLDLYRAVAGLDVGELGVFDARPFRGLIVEWPEMLADPESLAPTHILRIDMASGGLSRTYELRMRPQ